MTYVFDPDLSSVVATDTPPPSPPPTPAGPLSPQLLDKMLRYWEAANYLTVGQIYLQENPLLREPLTPEQIKPRLLGHWGTSPGLSLVYVQLGRLIKERDVNAIYLTGPGHGGPAIVAQVYLEGTYSEIYPKISEDEAGMRLLFRQFSTPGGIPSHVSVPTPGSINEGGELGYVLSHAFGAAFDNPDLLVAAVIGDGEAETGPLAGSWQGVSFLNPVRDGAVLPILHLNGYKIANPTVIARMPDEDVRDLIEAHGYEVRFVCGDDPPTVFQKFAATLDWAYDTIRAIQTEARTHGFRGQPRWPAIVLRTPKGWTGPEIVDGTPVEGTFRSHQVPLSGVRKNPDHLWQLEAWMRSYHPERNFDQSGKLVPELAELAPTGDRRMGANPHANGGKLLVDLILPDAHKFEVPIPSPGGSWYENTRPFGTFLRDVFSLNADTQNFRIFSPDELTSNRLGDVLEVENRCWVGTKIDIDDHLSPDGRVMEILSEHNCEGWLEGYTLTGRHGLFATYEAFAMIAASMMVQHSKWLQEADALPWRAPVSSLNILLTSTAWRNDHNGFSHQGPGLIDVLLSKKGMVSRIYLPPDANTLLSAGAHCLQSRDYFNLIAIDKQPHLQYLTLDEAEQHCIDGASIWHWAGNEDGLEPDVVLAAAGDVPTQEILAATEWLRHHVPELKIRVVNVVDLMSLFLPDVHPHGMSQERFVELFTADQPVVFAFHGYQRAIHEIVHGRPEPERFHVRGFNEQGTTTTPFDMVVLNEMSRFHLAALALKWAPRFRQRADVLIAELDDDIQQAVAYSREHFEDPPEIANWTWGAGA